MKPLFKVYAGINSITISVMLSLLLFVKPFLEQYNNYKMAKYGIAILTTMTIYTFLYTGLKFLFDRTLWVKKLILGNSFIEGTWIGSFKNGTKTIYTVEKFEQTYDQ